MPGALVCSAEWSELIKYTPRSAILLSDVRKMLDAVRSRWMMGGARE